MILKLHAALPHNRFPMRDSVYPGGIVGFRYVTIGDVTAVTEIGPVDVTVDPEEARAALNRAEAGEEDGTEVDYGLRRTDELETVYHPAAWREVARPLLSSFRHSQPPDGLTAEYLTFGTTDAAIENPVTCWGLLLERAHHLGHVLIIQNSRAWLMSDEGRTIDRFGPRR